MAELSRVSGRPLRYSTLDVSPADLAGAVSALRRDDRFVGANVTLPHKTAALALADTVSEEAAAVGAANLLGRAGACLHAHNTDSAGFADALRAAGFEARGRTALLLGAGGAARAVAHAWLAEGGEAVLVANRSLPRARDLARTAPEHIKVVSPGEGAPPGVDLVVNATSLGIEPGDAPLIERAFAPLLRATAAGSGEIPAFDLVYGRDRSPTPFLTCAREVGLAPLDDGMAMLICQAVRGFNLWMATELDPVELAARLSGR